jgi:hypothetical protein
MDERLPDAGTDPPKEEALHGAAAWQSSSDETRGKDTGVVGDDQIAV